MLTPLPTNRRCVHTPRTPSPHKPRPLLATLLAILLVMTFGSRRSWGDLSESHALLWHPRPVEPGVGGHALEGCTDAADVVVVLLSPPGLGEDIEVVDDLRQAPHAGV